MRFTEASIKRLRASTKGRKEHRDQRFPGLVLRCYPNGRKVWLYRPPRYYGRAKVTRGGETLGVYPGSSSTAERFPLLTAVQAIRSWERARGARHEAIELAEEIRRTEAHLVQLRFRAGHGISMADLVQRYMEDHVNKKMKRPEIIEYTLRRFLVEPYGDEPAAGIRRRHIAAMVQELVNAGSPAQARKSFYTIRALFKWAWQQDYVDSNPAENVNIPEATVGKHRALDNDEIAALLTYLDCDLRGDHSALGLGRPKNRCASPSTLRLLLDILALGQRRNEHLEATWNEIGEDGWWRIPVERMKKTTAKPKHEFHSVYRGPLAKHNIEQLRDQSKTWIFPAASGRKLSPHVATDTMARISQRLVEEGLFKKSATIHSLRHTFVTQLFELGADSRVVQVMIHHKAVSSQEGVISIYADPKFHEKTKELWLTWDEHLRSLYKERI